MDGAMSEVRAIDTAPRDGRTILVYGQPRDTEMVRFLRPGWHTAAWDEIDQAFCLTGGTWLGPFITPVCWVPVPEVPTAAGLPGGSAGIETRSAPITPEPVSPGHFNSKLEG